MRAQRFLWPTLLTALLAFTCSAVAASSASVYTLLTSHACRTISTSSEPGGSTQRCPGVAGYHLLVEDEDARMSVTVVAPGGKQYPLEYWRVVTTAFSSVGERAEWRVTRQGRRVVPLALIVRVDAHDNPDKAEKVSSYLAVAKITQQQICVTDKIRSGPNANEEARRAADVASTKPCLAASAGR
ncbi:MAG: hypothetical protein QOC99_3936 [Acidobacteriota bacterium]|nr:hypothetical protein [Acidobacteriota bacterium]MDT7781424.1 hypothetical protein [Acidobacteriota bacterium]